MSNPNFPWPLGPLAAGPVIGEQGENDAFIWAQAKTSSPLTLTVFPPNLPFTSTWTVTPRSDDFFCVIFHATGLTLPGIYEYELSSQLGKTQRFKLRRPPRKDGKRLRIIYGSCIQHPNKADTILKRMAHENADLLMLIGDNTYFQGHSDGPNDWDTEPMMMAAHLRWRGADGMRELCGNTPTLAIWDDHDFGSNDIDGTNPRKGEALRCFKRMWAQRHYGIPGTHGIFSSVRYGPAQIFLLDVRFQREERTNVIAQGQMQWLKDSLRASDAPVKLIVSGSQILPTAAVERDWECWKRDGNNQRRELLTFLANHAISGVVFVTGDVHLGQLMCTRGVERGDGRVGGDIWELTSSPLTQPMEKNPIMQNAQPLYDPYMIREVLVPNYGMIDINLERERKEIVLELRSVDSSLFRVEVDLERLQLRPRRKIRAFATGAGHSKAFFFRGKNFVEYDIAGRKVISGPTLIKNRWPDFEGEFDTGTEWPPGRTYFFKCNGYRHWGSSPGSVSEWTYISDFFHWPLEFQTGIDAVLLWSDGHAYAFKGRDYIKFNINTRLTVGNYPQSIAKWWKGVWEEGIDAVFPGPNGKLHFFRGDEYIQYDIHDDRGGPPEPIANRWPGLSF